MGNEHSIPRARRHNRLSKPPRPNTTPAAGTPVHPAEPGDRSSVLIQQDGLGNNRYSITSQNAVVGYASPAANVADPFNDIVVPEKKRRMSLFRSKSSQAKIQQLDMSNGGNIENLPEPPVRKSVLRIPERWSRSNSLVGHLEPNFMPQAPINTSHRWSRSNSLVGHRDPNVMPPVPINTSHRWSRTSSLFADEEKESPEKYASPVPSRWSRSNSLVEKEMEADFKYEFIPPTPRVPVLRTPEQRAQQVERYAPQCEIQDFN